VYGKLGIPASRNIPASRTGAANWIDNSGNLWLFGGATYDAATNASGDYLNDLWKFNSSTSEWAWMGGSNSTGAQSPGAYGTLGTPSTKNIPGARIQPASWVDNGGNLWLFGGSGIDVTGNPGLLNDLWKFNPSINQWTWEGGDSSVGVNDGLPGVYGTKGTFAAGNIPGSRFDESSWNDTEGNLWLFGGIGYDASGNRGYLDDLWEFKSAISEWAWIGGSSKLPIISGDLRAKPGVYGTLKTPAPGNTPGSRTDASTWIDQDGHLWLFAGYGFDSEGNPTTLNDLWEFNPSSKEWAWMSGSEVSTGCVEYKMGLTICGGQPGNYGTLNAPAAANVPGGRVGVINWTDASGHPWFFGGSGYDAKGDSGYLNDLWDFNPLSNEWTWTGGDSAIADCGTTSLGNTVCGGQPGVYGKLGTPATLNFPGGREGGVRWTDSKGNFWLFGGYGADAKGTVGFLNDLWVFPQSADSLPAATPAFSVAAGRYTSTQSVRITESTPNATIYYTLDGTTPSEKSAVAVYKAALSITKTTTVKAIALADGYVKSAVATAKYTILKAQTISFTPPASPVSYGVKPITLVATASSGLKVKFSVVSGPGKISGSTLGITGVGKVVVAANQAGNSTYGAAPQVAHSITVDKATLTVTAKNLTMKKGAAVPALTYKMAGFVKSDNQANATTGQPKLTTTATSKSAAGTYPITITAGTLAAANYSFTFVNGTLTVK
jgi:N-acetylneuraminic acid mutarotase